MRSRSIKDEELEPQAQESFPREINVAFMSEINKGGISNAYCVRARYLKLSEVFFWPIAEASLLSAPATIARIIKCTIQESQLYGVLPTAASCNSPPRSCFGVIGLYFALDRGTTSLFLFTAHVFEYHIHLFQSASARFRHKKICPGEG